MGIFSNYADARIRLLFNSLLDDIEGKTPQEGLLLLFKSKQTYEDIYKEAKSRLDELSL